MPADPAELLALAESAARVAGSLLVDGRPTRLDVTTKTTPTDVVTQMDTAAERAVIEALLGARPGDGVLGEEGDEVPSRTGVRWIVDPIDGTVNYLYGIPQYAVSIAAEADGQVVAGVVHDPEREETFTATKGGGARLNGRAVRCSAVTDLSQALVATGFGYDSRRRAAQGRVVAHVLPAVRDIRRMGAAALDLAAVACGRVDAFYERGLSPWDLAAGGLIAAEAGARVGGLAGRPAGPDLVVAAPPGLFEQLAGRLGALGADRE